MQRSTIRVRQATREDGPILLELIQALADYEKLPGPDAEARERLIHDGWPPDGERPRFDAWLAEWVGQDDSPIRVVGYAITYETYSTFLAQPTYYIEDLFVLPDFRRQSVGIALMEGVIAAAKALNCGRLEWVVLDWNTNAQQFYRKFGAQHLTEWHYYHLVI